MTYDSWDMERDRIFCHFGLFFCPFNPLSPHPPTNIKNPHNQNFEKMKKTSADIILHERAINDNHMIYSSLDMKCNRLNFFVILGHFLPFYPPKSPKNDNIKKT